MVKLVRFVAGFRESEYDRYRQPICSQDPPLGVGGAAAAGEEIVIAKAGKPKAKLVPYQPPRKKRRLGQNLLGITYIADDFDGPLPPEIQKYFE